jgi:serine/threonine protein phosphatase 1
VDPRVIDVLAYPSPEAAEAAAVYAIGDLHGRLDLLEAMEAAIARDIAAIRPARPLICYLGDYIDRGPDSAGVIDRLCGPFDDGVPRVFLKGNHEDRMLDFLENPAANGPSWMTFGGREALLSYGLDPPGGEDPCDWPRLRDALLGVLPPAHLAFLHALRLAFVWRGYLFVHAGVDPARPLRAQRPHDLMWIREPFLSSEEDWGPVVVHGHVITQEPQFRPNRIGIDTGAYRSGRLTCLVLRDGERRIISQALR